MGELKLGSNRDPVPLDLAIVIVNHNVRDLLDACLRSVETATPSLAVEIWVVDCGSSDGSSAMVRNDYPAVRVIDSDNLGFSRGNNLALREIAAGAVDRRLPRYVLLLNPDTELPATALEELVQFMDERPSIGAVGPRLVLADGSLDLACRRGFPTPLTSLYHFAGLSRLFPRSPHFARYNQTFRPVDGVYEVDSVVGAFMLVRGEVLVRVGLLDEAFFMYGEDLDWALRIKQAGWSVYYNGQVRVLHHKRASSRQRSRQSIVAFYAAMLVFFRKHYAGRTALVRLLVVAAIYGRLGMALAWNALERRPASAPRSLSSVPLPASSRLNEG